MQAEGHLAWPARVDVLLTTGLLIFAKGPICLKLEKAERVAGINSKLSMTAFKLLLVEELLQHHPNNLVVQ